jgi:stringent starvation protein B
MSCSSVQHETVISYSSESGAVIKKQYKTLATTNRSKRPYLIRAMHEWMGDNGNTPHIVVDAAVEGVGVPSQHVKDGKIILNISDSAAHNLQLNNDFITFRARFGGVPYDVVVPMQAVLGIYARETGQGMIFSHDNDEKAETPVPEAAPPAGSERQKRAHLKLVK